MLKDLKNRLDPTPDRVPGPRMTREKGFTLAELMVTLAINALLFFGLVAVFVANLNHYRNNIDRNRLNQQLQTALYMMTNDIRRAGYWANAQTDVGSHANNNPFVVTGSTDVTVNPGGDCILLTYDLDKNGTLNALNVNADDERYGYRLQDEAIQARPPGAAFSCTAAANAWENITDTRTIRITALSFTLTTRTVTTGPGTKGLAMRSVDISLTGQLVKDATVSKTLTQHVEIRNDKFIP